jgi:hypothetical protein
MKTKDDGGPAYPCEAIELYQGMSIRDAFAMAVLQASHWPSLTSIPDIVAKECYRMADAMIAERKK